LYSEMVFTPSRTAVSNGVPKPRQPTTKIVFFSPKETSPVNANVNAMSTADEQIRVSAETKRELERRKREGESFEDVLDRILKNDRDLLAGFGSWSDGRAEKAREVRQKGKEKSKERMRRVAGSDEGT